MKKRLLALVLAALLTASAAGCASAPASSAGTESTPAESKAEESSAAAESTPDEGNTGEVVKLQMLSMPANSSGVFEGWGADIIKEKIGVEIELLPSGDQGEQKLQALMASGELPDVVVFKENKQIINAVAGDMLLAFDDYKDQVPNVYKNAAKSLQYYADNVSEGKGKSYAVGSDVKTAIPTKGELNWGPYLRYEAYTEVGAPAIKTSDDYLDVLKQMQDKYPTNADGKKRYAFSIWSDWDRSYMSVAICWGQINGVNYPNEGTLVELDYNNDKVISMVEEDSWYMKGLEMFYKANQMGLMDPDSMTQRFDDAVQKGTDDRVLFSFWGWALGNINSADNQNNGIGYMPVMAENAKILHQGLQPIGKPWAWAVSKASKNPEKAFQLVDMMYNGEALMELKNGPKGTIWDVGENGMPVMLEDGYSYTLDPTKELPQGGNMGGNITSGSVGVFNAYGLSDSELISEYKNSPLNRDLWEKPSYAPADTKIKDEWQEKYKAEDQIDYLTQRDAIAVAPFVAFPLLTDEMEQISARVGEVLQPMSWKMVYAKDDAEYNKLKAEMIEKCKGLGIDKFTEWYAAEYAKALTEAAKYAD